MSRARELAKFGGSGQQTIAGVSSHVGVSTFASNVFMYQDLSVTGNINVTGDLTYDEVSARNQFTSGITTTADLIVTRNANFSGIITAAKGVAGNINATGVSTAAFLQATTVNASGIVTAGTFSGSGASLTGVPVSTGISGLGANVATFLATPLSANLIAVVSDETGSGSLVFGTTPTLVNPTITGSVQGNVNATGVSTAAFLQATTVNASGIVTAGTFSGSGASLTGVPISTGVSGLAAGAATFLATPSSANLATLLTDETGSGANVFATTPTLVNPTITGSVQGNINATGISTATTLNSTTATITTATITTANITNTNSTNTVLSGITTVSNTVQPSANNTVSLGTSGNRWANVYSNDLDLSNEGSANDIDGTWGSFLVQEGEEHLYIINRRSGKKFRFVLEEI